MRPSIRAAAGAVARLFFCAAALAWTPFAAWRACVVLSRVPLERRASTPLFEDARGNFLSDGQAVYGALGFWDLGREMPEKISRAALAIEDRRFASHPGLDLLGLGRALLRTLSGKTEGGSTLAMQVVRLQHPRARTLQAKVEEAASAILSTALYGRDAQLRAWLRIVPVGGTMHGMSYAARRYFRRPLQDLSWAQASLLLAIPQSPATRSLHSFRGFLEARLRARVILAQLKAQGIIDADEMATGMVELEETMPFDRESRPEDSYHYVFRVLDEYAAREPERQERPLRTSLDPDIQGLVTGLARGAVGTYRSLGADNMAVMVAELSTGRVLGYLGSAAYFDPENRGAIDYARVKRSSGSTLKPFFYAYGLESGTFHPGSILADTPLRIKDASGEYAISDFDDSWLGPMLYRAALGNSRNATAVRVLQAIGLEDCYRWLGSLGLHDWERPASFYGLGMAIGGIYTSLDRQVAAFGTLANDGKAFRLRWFADQEAGEGSALMTPEAARMTSLFLSDVEARLPSFEGTALTNFPFPVALKTGTSNGFRDAWAIGYSRRYVAGIWVGHSGHRQMNHMAGSTAAAFLLQLFSALQSDAVRGVAEEPFPAPEGWEAVSICPLSGQRAGGACPRSLIERFPSGAVPQESCSVHRRAVVDSLSGQEANPSTPAYRRVERTLTVLGPEYAAFSQARGYGIPGPDPQDLQTARVSVVSPLDGIRVQIDPEIPRRFQSLALRAVVEPPVPDILWLVDGKEFARVPWPYEARWPISPGRHSIQAKFPNAFVESETVSVTVLEE